MAKKSQKQLEAERKKKLKEAEEKKEKEMESEVEADEAEDGIGKDGDPDADDGDHADADKDKMLIKKMIKQYLGDGSKDVDSGEMEALAKQAYQAHKEMGAKEEEAYERAGHAIKLAHHMAKQEMEKESETHECEDDDMAKDKKKKAPADDGGGDEGESEAEMEAETETESENEQKKESLRDLKKKLLETEGRMAALEVRVAKEEISKYVEKSLRESKLPVQITKRFREAAGDFKSKKDFDAKWKIFQEGIKNFRPEWDFGGLMTEKASTNENGKRGEKESLDFSTCAE